jgi:hypothetical protein
VRDVRTARKPRVPSYQLHSSGQARVTIIRKDHLLRPSGTEESREASGKFISDWINKTGFFAPPPPDEDQLLTVRQLLDAWLKHVKREYDRPGKENTQHVVGADERWRHADQGATPLSGAASCARLRRPQPVAETASRAPCVRQGRRRLLARLAA